MGRRYSAAPSRDEQLGAAGAATLNDIEQGVRDDRHFRYRVQRDEANDAYRAGRDAVEDRRADSMDEIRKYNFEHQKALDANEEALRKDLMQEAVVAGQALRDIRTDDEDASAKLAQWAVDHYRMLDGKVGNPRLIRQFELNRGFVDSRRKQMEEQKKIDNAKASGLVQSSVTSGGVTYSTPKPDKSDDAEMKMLERDRKHYADLLSKAEGRRNTAKDEDTKKLFAADATEYRQKMTEAESALRSFREAGAGKETPKTPTNTATLRRDPAKAVKQFMAMPSAERDKLWAEYRSSPSVGDISMEGISKWLTEEKGFGGQEPGKALDDDPRIALAKKALDDPSASPEHKAAARKILGL